MGSGPIGSLKVVWPSFDPLRSTCLDVACFAGITAQRHGPCHGGWQGARSCYLRRHCQQAASNDAGDEPVLWQFNGCSALLHANTARWSMPSSGQCLLRCHVQARWYGMGHAIGAACREAAQLVWPAMAPRTKCGRAAWWHFQPLEDCGGAMTTPSSRQVTTATPF